MTEKEEILEYLRMLREFCSTKSRVADIEYEHIQYKHYAEFCDILQRNIKAGMLPEVTKNLDKEIDKMVDIRLGLNKNDD